MENEVDEQGRSLLHLAISRGDAARVKFLLEKKANVNAANNYKSTPLHYACLHNQPLILAILLQCEDLTNVSPVATGFTPLDDAILNCNRACVDLLLEAGGKVVCHDPSEFSSGWFKEVLVQRQNAKNASLILTGILKKRKKMGRDMATFMGRMVWASRQNEEWLM